MWSAGDRMAAKASPVSRDLPGISSFVLSHLTFILCLAHNSVFGSSQRVCIMKSHSRMGGKYRLGLSFLNIAATTTEFFFF